MKMRKLGWVGIGASVMLFFGARLAAAATIAWDGGVGGTGTNWNDAANWSGDVKPGAGDRAEFTYLAGATTKAYALGAPQTVGAVSFPTYGNQPTVTIGNGADVAAGNTLTLWGSVFRGDNVGNWQTIAADVVLPTNTSWEIRAGYNSGVAVAGSLRGTGAWLDKWGSGVLALQGSNVYEGSLLLSAGTATFDFNGATAPVTNIWNPAAPVVLNGGVVNFAAKQAGSGARNVQTVDSLVVSNGASRATVSAHWNNNLMRANFGAITRATGATLTLVHPSGNTVITANNGYGTSNANDASGILGAYLTVAAQGATEAADWAVNDGVLVTNYTAYTDLAGANPPINDAPTANIRETGGSTGDIGLGASTVTVNTFAMKDSASRTLAIGGGNTLRLGAVGGILTASSSGPLLISGGTLTAGGAADTAGEILFQNAKAVTNSAVIADNGTGAVALTKGGGGNLVLTTAPTHTGGTYVNAGGLYLPGGVNPLVTSGLLAVNGGTLDLGNATQTNTSSFGVRGGTVQNGTLVKTGSDYMMYAGTVSAKLSGPVGLLKVSPGTLILSGSPAYTGVTTVLEGKLDRPSGAGDLKGDLVIGSLDGGLPASYTTPSNGNGMPSGKNVTVYPNGYFYQGDYPGINNLTVIGGTADTSWPNIDGTISLTGGTLNGGPVQGNHGAHFAYASAKASRITGEFRISSALWYDPYFNVEDGEAPIDLVFAGSFKNETATRSVNKNGAGVMQLTSSGNIFNEKSFNLNGGTLLVDNASGAGVGKSPVIVAGGATLGGTGFIGGVSNYSNANVTATGSVAGSTTNLAAVAPGTLDVETGAHVIGTLTMGSLTVQTNNVTFGAHSALKINVGTNGACDRLVVNGTLSLATATDRLELSVAGDGALPAGTYNLVTFQQLAAAEQIFETVTGLPERGSLAYTATGIDLVVTAKPPKGTIIQIF